MAPWYPRHARRAFKGLVGLAVATSLLYVLGLIDLSARRYKTWSWTPCQGKSLFDPTCTSSKAVIARTTQIIVKTGGSEPQSRLHSLLTTVVSRVPKANIIFLSDMEEEVKEHHIHDIYADISIHERAIYPEFALYDRQQEYLSLGKDTRLLEGGWKLSKYMTLAMKRKIWALQEAIGDVQARKKWFVFIETDTFVDWDNFFTLLEHLDPAKRVYIGSPVWLPKLQFAHGGSAYALSYAALEALNSRGDLDAKMLLHSQYGVNVTALCCGDEALARALKPRGVSLKGYWPMFNGEIPATVPFGKDMWCEPVITLHHLSGKDMENLWQWTEDRKAATQGAHPTLFKDLFEYISPRIPHVMEDWDNTDDSIAVSPKQKTAHTSFEDCSAACDSDGKCFQFLHDSTTCTLSHHIRLGRNRAPDDKEKKRYRSGWKLERIQRWTSKAQCESAHWVTSNP